MQPILINSQGSVDDNSWKPQPDWWNIENIFNQDPDPNKCFIVLLEDSLNENWIYPTDLGGVGSYYKTSDGVTYSGGPDYTHVWNQTYDKPCSLGYKTRYIIVYNSDKSNISFNVFYLRNVIYAYIGTCNISTIRATNRIQGFKKSSGSTCSSNAYNSIAFNSCNILGYCDMIEGATTIGTGAFGYCYVLKKINISNSITKIDSSAFSNCRSLSSINIPDSVTFIGGSCFDSCSALQNVKLSNNITSLETNTFINCYSLNSIIIPNGVTVINSSCFYGNNSLMSITIPKTITSMDITGLTSLSSINIESGWIAPSFNISASNFISISSLIDMINKLGIAPTTRTITIGSANLAKLTTAQIALANSKRYTLA